MDSDSGAFAESFSDVPWLAIPFDAPERDQVIKKYSPPGVPTLTIIKPNGDTIALEGDSQLGDDGAVDAWLSA